MSRKSDDSGGEIAVGCLLVLITIPVGCLMRGFVLAKLWYWFLVPFGLPAISLAHAYGLAVTVALFHGLSSSSKSEGSDSIWGVVGKAICGMILAPLFVWLIGYICFVNM